MIQLLTGRNEVTYYLLKEEWFLPLTVLTNIWKGVVWNSIIYFAAESLPASGTVLTLYIDSGAIAQGLLSADSYFGVFKNAATICVKEGLEASNYIKVNYPRTSSADGYTIYSKTERV